MTATSTLLNLSYYSEIIAFLVTILFFIKVRSKVSTMLMALMCIIMITESLGRNKDFFKPHINIFLAQNVEILYEIATYLFIYYFSVNTPGLKRWIGLMIISFIVFSGIFAVYWQPLNVSFPTKSIALGGIFILCSILIYFYEGIKNMQEHSFYKDYLFYISIGLFIFYANEIPAMTLLNYYLERHADISKVSFIFYLKITGSIIYYSLYTFGILWTIRK